jgi:hypothetical protein
MSHFPRIFYSYVNKNDDVTKWEADGAVFSVDFHILVIQELSKRENNTDF